MLMEANNSIENEQDEMLEFESILEEFMRLMDELLPLIRGHRALASIPENPTVHDFVSHSTILRANQSKKYLQKIRGFGSETCCPICLENDTQGQKIHVVVTNCIPHNHIYHYNCYSILMNKTRKTYNGTFMVCLICRQKCSLLCTGYINMKN
jgi:hypothetical protein